MNLRDGLPVGTTSFHGLIPVRLDGAPTGPLAGMGLWRGIKDFEHGTICRAFNLDPTRFYFDLPSVVRGVGRNSTGASFSGHRNRLVNGYILHSAYNDPIGKLTIVTDADKFKDVDPRNLRDFLDLSHS